EGVTMVGDIAYWTGSGGQYSDVIFATKVYDFGRNSRLEWIGKVTNMRQAIEDWGKAHTDFKVVTATGTKERTLDDAMHQLDPEDSTKLDKSWYNIEGIVMKPGDTTAYIALRAPLVAVKDAAGKIVDRAAILLPVTNFAKLFADEPFKDAAEKTPK